jgi:hypothetical protein
MAVDLQVEAMQALPMEAAAVEMAERMVMHLFQARLQAIVLRLRRLKIYEFCSWWTTLVLPWEQTQITMFA